MKLVYNLPFKKAFFLGVSGNVPGTKPQWPPLPLYLETSLFACVFLNYYPVYLLFRFGSNLQDKVWQKRQKWKILHSTPVPRNPSLQRFISVYYLLICLNCANIERWHFKDLGLKNDLSPPVMQIRFTITDWWLWERVGTRRQETARYCRSGGRGSQTLNSRGSFRAEPRCGAELWLIGSRSTCTHQAWLPCTLSLSWEPKLSLLHIHHKTETLYRYSQIEGGWWLSGGEYSRGKAARTANDLLRGTGPWQSSSILILKSRRPPANAYLPKKIMQLQGQFYHGLSSFLAELNKRRRVTQVI